MDARKCNHHKGKDGNGQAGHPARTERVKTVQHEDERVDDPDDRRGGKFDRIHRDMAQQAGRKTDGEENESNPKQAANGDGEMADGRQIVEQR